MENKRNTIDALIEQGKTNGRLTTKEITDALEELDFDVDQINTFYDNCESLNIEIVEDMNMDADLRIGLDSALTDDLEMALSTEGIAIDDPVKIYSPLHASTALAVLSIHTARIRHSWH